MTNPSTRGTSPSATGGAGVSFAHRVAATYCTAMLTGARCVELYGFAPVRISFQRDPAHPVDDLLIESAGTAERPSLAIACRLTPSFVRSHDLTIKLLGSLLCELATFDSPNHQVAIALAGWNTQFDQVRRLTAIARDHADAASFTASVKTPGRFKEAVRKRYDHLHDMVAKIGEDDQSLHRFAGLSVEDRTWRLLARTHLLSFNVQDPDRTDWMSTATALDPLTVEDVEGTTLLDEIASRCSEYDAAGAVVDVSMLRRDIHSLLGAKTRRTSAAWRSLTQHDTYAVTAVRRSLGLPHADKPEFTFDFTERRAQLAEKISRAGDNKVPLVVTGPSGTGKSALVLEVIESLRNEHDCDAIVLNFRSLPDTTFAFEALLGCPLHDLLSDLSAPRRLLIIDAADAAFERSSTMLADLTSTAHRCGLGLIAISSDTVADLVTDQVTRSFGTAPGTYVVPMLSDDEVSEVSTHLPALRGLLRNLGQTSLLRRLVVLDLISRTGRTLDEPLGEWGCLEIIWNNLIRSRGKDGTASPEAREHTMLAVAAADLERSATSNSLSRASAAQTAPPVPVPVPVPQMDYAAVDSLQSDHLLAPRNLRQPRLEFAHDELRRYATAVLLSRADSISSRLKFSGAPRWSLSAATLACKGQLLDPQLSPESSFIDLLVDFSALAKTFGPRWVDVPVEAVLDTPYSYRCLAASLPSTTITEASITPEKQPDTRTTARITLDDLLRVVNQRITIDGLVDVVLGEPVIALLVDHTKPWDISHAAFDVLTSWLTALTIADFPAGQNVRLRLRTKLIAFWALFPPIEPDTEEVERVRRFNGRYRRQRLNYELTKKTYVETLALLGRDTDDQIEQCLRTLASLAPELLAPAVDAPWSARSIASYNVYLLSELIEAYYIDDTTDYNSHIRDEGIRMHQGRWTSIGPPFNAYWFGGFWALFNSAPLQLSARVLNRVLNHAADVRVEQLQRRSREASWVGPKYTLDLGPVTVTCRGDAQMWSWYRGSSTGPYPCFSALQAMERVAESYLRLGGTAEDMVEILLQECENLAVPGMIFGLLTRNLEDVGRLIDPFLAEPFVWKAEFAGSTLELIGRKADTEGLAHPERRKWTPPETAMTMVLSADEPRREELRALGQKLIENGRNQGLKESARNWATCLDVTYFKLYRNDENSYITVEPPEDVRAAQEKHASASRKSSETLRLQNLYRENDQYRTDYTPPTHAQVASDLVAARHLLESASEEDLFPPIEAAACVIRTAILRAADGSPEALGDQADFAVEIILEIAASFLDRPNQRDEGQFYALGRDRSAAIALPALLSTVLEDTLNALGVDTAKLSVLGDAVASNGPLETRLFLARGCDRIWRQTYPEICPSASTPHGVAAMKSAPASLCPHAIAFNWLVNSTRDATFGPWDPEGKRRNLVRIDGDLAEDLQSVEGRDIDIAVLDAAIRGLGTAASHQHCYTEQAAHLLAQLLEVQARAMVAHEAEDWTGDDRGHHTLVAARALLQTCDPTNPEALLAHLDILRAYAGLITNFLHGLAASGAETIELAKTTRAVWPRIITRALSYADTCPNVFDEDPWGKWAISALLPEPVIQAQGMYNEITTDPIDWVVVEDLVPFIESWLLIARGKTWCLDALISFISRLSGTNQVTRGLGWVEALCLQDDKVLVSGTAVSNEWLISIRSEAERRDHLEHWQSLVDAMVVSGNSQLAPYST